MNQLEALDIECPYYGESIGFLVDCSVESQNYIEDCQVCCRPINFFVTVGEGGVPSVSVSHEDEV